MKPVRLVPAVTLPALSPPALVACGSDGSSSSSGSGNSAQQSCQAPSGAPGGRPSGMPGGGPSGMPGGAPSSGPGGGQGGPGGGQGGCGGPGGGGGDAQRRSEPERDRELTRRRTAGAAPVRRVPPRVPSGLSPASGPGRR